MGKLATSNFGNKHSPRQVLIDALESAEDMEVVVIVTRTRDQLVKTAWSDGRLTERIGLTEMAKIRMIDASLESED